VFVGSFNFDPRSARLNTEMGLVIASSAMAGQLHEFFTDRAPQRAYAVSLTPQDKIEWTETTPFGTRIVYTSEPNTSAARRGMVDVLAVLPIDWLL
jgi:putative cardiolipin synthase